ncbi:hypothetical protein ML462_10980 [Gramella lutea]|uniref:HhH-GPD domain-containing protein n=1 Tax=Christiangramia lutea TaxID=1607951 RepID=A0A9X1V694_9FLAO|nr:hypothetical protein [Christiangramia lutea]MCH4823694.1 hypothetical protein [Christiangramia lutea]
MNQEKIIFFQDQILEWYYKNHRNYDWRKQPLNAYNVVISEILLQRTQANTVAKFYPVFLEKYPNWEKLIEANEKDLQKFLIPVGLNNQKGTRLFNLAQTVKKLKGVLPDNKDDIKKLPMIGQYIANAYETFILNKPAPLLDVNMARVLERYFQPRKLSDIRYDPFLQKISYKIIDHSEFKKLNWAILDYGALVCKARKPLCENCGLTSKCTYFNKIT